jgi:KaiC/GvpD/RAD55 family RecA-like ATPase
MRRVHTSIPGLDRLVEGGFPDGSAVLVKGPAGTGKSLLGLQFLYGGVTEANAPGMLIQAGGFGTTLMWYEEMLGWDFAKLQEKGKLVIYSFKPKDYEKFNPTKVQGEVLGKLKNIIVPMGIRRVVIDAITPLGETLKEMSDYRRSLYETIEFLKENNLTSIIISEDGATQEYKRRMHVEERLCDGVISLRQVEEQNGEFRKQLIISKMLATNFPIAWYPVAVTNRGFSVRPFL